MSPTPPATPAQPQKPAAGQSKPFSILEYDVEGNTLLPVMDVERAVMEFLGENKTIKDIEAARVRLEKSYHDRGYKTVLVNIPPQQVTGGVVRLRVTEAPVGKLRIVGSRYHSPHVIRATMAQLNQGSVPDFGEVQKELGEANRSPDLHVTPILKASDTPGKVDVDLEVKDTLPLHFILEANDRYSANTTHTRVSGEIRYDNLFQANQSLSLQYQTAPSRISDAKIGSFSYVIPTAGGPVIALYAVHSDSNVAAIGTVDVIGKGDIYGIRLIEPLPTSSPTTFYHSFTAGVDYKDFKQTVVLQGATSSVESPVSYPPFTLEYSGTLLGAAPKDGKGYAATSGSRTNTSIDLSLNFIIQGLGTDWKQFASRRADAGTSYLILRPSLTHEQVLPAQWSLVARIDGQLSSGPLINNEQYSAGGVDSVRGYTEAERLGDNGIHGSLELRTPQLLAHPFPRVEQSYLSLFTDAAKVTVLQALPGQDAGFTLASAGVGLRFKAFGLAVALDGARTLKDGYVTPGSRYRGDFRITYAY